MWKLIERSSPAALDAADRMEQITVLLADDSLFVREGLRALLARDPGVAVVGVAADRDELIRTAVELHPQVIVTDIRMSPTFRYEGIEGAKEVRRHHPGTGVVVLSQYDEPEYAIALLADGAAGFAYLLKDRVTDSHRLSRAIREVATGGSMLDPEIVTAILSPVRLDGELTEDQDALLAEVARGRPLKAIAATRRATAEAVNAAVEEVFLALVQGAASDRAGARAAALRRLRMLHTAILRREEQGEVLSRLLPGGLAEKLRLDVGAARRTEELVVTVLMSDVRGYSEIAERTDPVVLAGQLNAHRREMNAAILTEQGTVMQYVGDAVMAVFGAPFPQSDQAARACRAAAAMHAHQRTLNRAWADGGLEPFGLGIGISTGEVAAGFLGSEERLEYTLVGDTVNLAQRLCDLARPAGTTVVSAATVDRLGPRRHGHGLLVPPEAGLPDVLTGVDLVELPPQAVKGRVGAVRAFRLGQPGTGPAGTGRVPDGSTDSDQRGVILQGREADATANADQRALGTSEDGGLHSPNQASLGPAGTGDDPPPPDSGSEGEPVRIHVQAHADPESPVDETFTVSVVLAREDIRRAGSLADVGGDFDVVEGKPLVVEVVPRAHLDTVGAARKDVMIPGPGRPQVVLFNLRATHQGRGELWIIVSQGQVPLCTLVLSIRVVETPAESAEQATDEVSVALTGSTKPLHMLRIVEQQQGNSIVYRYDLEAPDLELLAAFASRPVQQNRDNYVRSLYRRIEDSWGTCQRDVDRFHDELRAFGGELLDELVPTDLRRLLWENRHRLRNIIVLSTEPFIPWELLHLKAPDTSRLPDETCFLGQLGLVRWLWGTWPPEKLALRPQRARFITPNYPDKRYLLPSVKDEQRFLAQHLEAVPVEPHHREVIDLLRSENFDLLHFAGHAIAASENIADAQLLLEGRLEGGPRGDRYVPEPLRASLVAQYMTSGDARPIVVINACQTGRLGHQLSSIGGFAQAFLAGGASVFVSSLWSVGDTPAFVFVEAFYRRLFAGASLAEAAIAGREAARTLGDATWLAYTVYGHPEARLEPQ